MKVQMSNKGWHRRWFYLKNDASHGVPEFDHLVFYAPPEGGRWGAPSVELPRMEPLFWAIVQ